MEICSRFTGMERKNGAFLLHTDNADVKVCFVTDEIVRVRASFDHELAEEPYVLMTTAWEDRIKPLPDAALYRSTRIHHTPDSYTKRELVGAGPLHLAYARPFCRLKAPLGLSLLRCAAQTRTFENTLISAACKKRKGNFGKKREDWTVPALLTSFLNQKQVIVPYSQTVSASVQTFRHPRSERFAATANSNGDSA